VFDWLKRNSPASEAQRWVVLDLETTGLDPKRDRIIEIGAVAIVNGAIELGDYFHRVLVNRGEVSAENRVVHGVTAAEQSTGFDLSDALGSLAEWMHDAPLIGFHTNFDIGFLRAAIAQHADASRGKHFASAFLDLAVIAPAVFTEERARSLSEWSQALKLPVRKQHRALADALTTAHLLQRVQAALPVAQRTFAELKTIENGRRWL
jgi:DNA polymerase III subunit epsilon